MPQRTKKKMPLQKPSPFFKNGYFLAIILFFVLFGVFAIFRSYASTAPVLGFYRGAVGDGNIYKGPSGIDKISTWLGRDITLGTEFPPDASWTDIEGNNWMLSPWGAWISAKSGRHLNYAIPPFPASGGSLDECATGAYNAHWQKLGQNFVAYKMPNTYFRFGWEMNGNFFRWSAINKATAYIGCYRQFVDAMRATPNNAFKFTWNPNGGGYSAVDLSTYYPGDSYVDYVGIDTYNHAYSPNSFPYPNPCDATCISTHQANAWSAITTSQYGGLNWFSSFAKAHGKQIAVPEWGTGSRPDGHGGLDDPNYIRRMYDWINDGNNNVAWVSYEDFTASDFNTRITQVPSTMVMPWPNATAKFLALFGTPAATAAPDATGPIAAIINPTAGSTVSGLIPVQANASDSSGVNRVEFYLDGSLGKTESASPFCLAGDVNSICSGWDSRKFANGIHNLMIKAFDQKGNTTSASTSFTINNPVTPSPSTTPTPIVATPTASPVVAADSQPPKPPSNLRTTLVTNDTISLQWNSSSDNVGVAGYTVYRSGASAAKASGVSYLIQGLAPGTSYTVSVAAYDAAGNISTNATVTVSTLVADTGIGTVGPPIYITPPGSGIPVMIASGSTPKVSGTIGIANGPAASQTLQVKVDGSYVDSTGMLDTTYLTNGSHLVTIEDGKSRVTRKIQVANNLPLWKVGRNYIFSAFHGNKTKTNIAEFIAVFSIIIVAVVLTLCFRHSNARIRNRVSF